MIYDYAAERKTRDHDDDAIRSFKSRYADQLQPVATQLREAVEQSGSEAETADARQRFREMFDRVVRAMRAVSNTAVAATRAGAVTEHGHKVPESAAQTNGEKRAEDSGIPTQGQIASAASTQLANVVRLAEQDADTA